MPNPTPEEYMATILQLSQRVLKLEAEVQARQPSAGPLTIYLSGTAQDIQLAFSSLSLPEASRAIINLITKNQESTMAYFDELKQKIADISATVETETDQIEAKIADLQAMAASDRITPEQKAVIELDLAALKSKIANIIPDTPVPVDPPAEPAV